MIDVLDNSQCCGCEACVQVCPKSCIKMKEDVEGFLYPKVSTEDCTDCRLCENVCPVIHQYKQVKPLKYYAAKNKNKNARLTSSSGGVFFLLAETVIQDGGIVFGAKFNESWEVVHGYSETIEGLAAFKTSKYVQSRIANSYKEARFFLDSDRKVLFSGTSCQIAGLKRYLRKDYDNLLTVDVLCHGVPSPKVWQLYLDELKSIALEGEKSISFPLIPHVSERDAQSDVNDVSIESISFRDKRTGWKKFSFSLTLAKAVADGKKNTVLLSHIHREDPYMIAFIRNLILRPACYHCSAKGGKSNSDITLADFWTIKKWLPEFDDNIGISLVIINTEKGKDLYNTINNIIDRVEVTGRANLPNNYYNPPKLHPNRKLFFCKVDSSENSIIPLLIKYGKPTMYMRVKRWGDLIKACLRKVYKCGSL